MKKLIMLLIMLLIALLVVILSYLLIELRYENPFTTLATAGNEIFDKPSPANWVKESQILVYPDRIVILVPNATMSRYAATKSMDPIFDYNANGIS